MATKKRAKKASAKSATATAAEPVDPRTHLEPTPANFKAALAELDAVLADVPAPEEPSSGDLVSAMLHFQMCRGMECGYGQEALRRIEAEFVDRNEFRVTEAFEVQSLVEDLGLPDVFDRCLAAQESVAQVYNDQNGITLEFLREAAVSDRNHFFARVSAIDPEVSNYLVNHVSFEEICFSDRSTLRVQQRMGFDPKNKATVEFIAALRERLKPYGHIPISVGPDGSGGKPNLKHPLSPASILTRFGPAPKKKK